MKIAMIGKGGHSKVIKDIILSNKEYEIVGYLDDQYEDADDDGWNVLWTDYHSTKSDS